MLFSIAKVALTANSMSGDARGMLDFGLDRMILAGGEGRALACRLLGVGVRGLRIAGISFACAAGDYRRRGGSDVPSPG